MSKKMSYEVFLEKAHESHGNEYIYDEETERCFNGSHSYIPIICRKHGKFWTQARQHLKYECAMCSYEKRGVKSRSNSFEFEEKARKIHGDKYIYTDTYKTAKNDKVCIICPIHGEFWQLPNDHLSGKGCPNCNESHLERQLAAFLDERGIGYERWKHFDWLDRQEIDFYVPQYNVGVECQGKQHIGLGGWSNRFDFKREYELDKRKNKLCEENGLQLLYFCDKTFYEKFFELDIYNDNSTFCNLNELVDKICEKQK